MPVDESLLDGFIRKKGQRDMIRPSSGVGGGDEPPSGSTMVLLTARVEGLEKRMDRFEMRLDGIDTRLRGVETGLATLGGKIDGLAGQLGIIVSRMPSWWQAPLSTGGLLALILALIGLASHFHWIG